MDAVGASIVLTSGVLAMGELSLLARAGHPAPGGLWSEGGVGQTQTAGHATPATATGETGGAIADGQPGTATASPIGTGGATVEP